MARLTFKDINEWTPSSISIVDEPSHPLCHFEVYEDDEEYVKKSIDITGSEIMTEGQNPSTTEEGRVSVSESFLEKLLGRSIIKSTEPSEPPAQTPAKNDGNSAAEKIMAKLDEMDKKIGAIDGRVSKLEKGEDPEPNDEGNNGDPAPGAVGKNDDDSEGNTPNHTDGVLDTKNVVAKSQELDPDNSTISTTTDSFMKRAGRNSNGMTW